MSRRRHGVRGGLRACAGALAALGLCASAQAEPPDASDEAKRGHGFERLVERHADRLGLDAPTRQRIQELAAQSREVSDPQRAERDRLRGELHEMLSAESPDLDAVLAKAEEIGRADTELRKERLRTLFAIRVLLTPEQRRELVRIHEERRAEWGEHKRRFHHGGPDRWREESGQE